VADPERERLRRSSKEEASRVKKAARRIGKNI